MSIALFWIFRARARVRARPRFFFDKPIFLNDFRLCFLAKKKRARARTRARARKNSEVSGSQA